VWTAGVEETLTAEKMGRVSDSVPDPQTVIDMISSMSALRRTPRLADVAQTAVFLASDRAAGITGSMTNVTAGLVLR
jgi:enoyl-[acyl-carrier-protein] reductase (NADH)